MAPENGWSAKKALSDGVGGVCTKPLDCIDVCRSIVPYCEGSFVFVTGINKMFRDAWKNEGLGVETLTCGPHTTAFQLHVSFAHLNLIPSVDVCIQAAIWGKVQCLVVAFDHGCKIDQSVSNVAARFGQIEVLAWLRRNDYEFDHEEVCMAAAQGGSIDALRWCRKNGVVWTNQACLSAARWGKLDVLKFLVEKECNLLGEELPVHTEAASGRHADVMRYLSTNRVENFRWNSQEALEKSLGVFWGTYDELMDMPQFLTEVLNICEDAQIPVSGLQPLLMIGPNYFEMLLKNFHMVVGHPNPVLPADVLDQHILTKAAVSGGSMRMVEWVIEQGFPCDETRILSDALSSKRMVLLKALIDGGRRWTDASSREGFLKAAEENRVADLVVCTKQTGGEAIFGNGRGNDLCETAALYGAVDALRFAMKETRGWKSSCICWQAISTGRLEVVKTAVQGGAPLDPGCIFTAIEEGQTRILEYLLDIKCPIGD